MKNTAAMSALLAAVGVAMGAAFAVPASLPPAPVADRDFHHEGRPRAEQVELGRLLFFDKILSGNKNIACATCHHPALGSADAVALPLGEGPRGLGPDRQPGGSAHEAVTGRVPRNSPALFNVGAREFTRLFHDGRVETDPNGYYEGGFITPAKWKLPQGLDNVLAAQAMFPVLSPAEMAGDKGENPVADAVSLNNAAGSRGAWAQIAGRLQAIPEYVELFERAFPRKVKSKEDISFVLAANAIAAFETVAFRADNSPFDRLLRGERHALTPPAKRGMTLFYGEAGCSTCHSGTFQTDHDFHAIAMPQIGPGKGDGSDASYWRATGLKATLEDYGRGRVTYREEDNYKFRTPSLRNVALTGPWGHDGAYDSLEAVVRHHLDPVTSLNRYQPTEDLFPPLGTVLELTGQGSQFKLTSLSDVRQDGFRKRDTWVHENPTLRQRIAEANELSPVRLSEEEVNDLLAFLESLTDPASRVLDHWAPERVPSGLPVQD